VPASTTDFARIAGGTDTKPTVGFVAALPRWLAFDQGDEVPHAQYAVPVPAR
jgi:hypothetical protein